MSFATELNNSKSTESKESRTWGSSADIGLENVLEDLGAGGVGWGWGGDFKQNTSMKTSE